MPTDKPAPRIRIAVASRPNRIEDHLAGAVVIALGILALLAAFAG